MHSLEQLRFEFGRLEAEGKKLAGELTNLAQRATVYHHIYEHSGGNHIFPLIAAHGALWAGGYFRFGIRLGQCLSIQYVLNVKRRQAQVDRLNDFADAFREINRRVCIDTYAKYHFTAAFGEHPLASKLVEPELLQALAAIHGARRSGKKLDDQQKRAAFKAHFLNEQDSVVEPTIDEATKNLTWPFVKFIALRPIVRFAYFPGQRRLWFRDFSSKAERISKGLSAFDTAAEVGWERVEASLKQYDLLPSSFFANSVAHFSTLKAIAIAG